MFNPQICLDKIKLLKIKNPLIHCVTNNIASNLSANILLAIGASPAMTVTTEESYQLASMSAALLINIGAITPARVDSMQQVVTAASQQNIPWVLDPVVYGVLKYRSKVCDQLMTYQPTIIRGNASEINSLAGFEVSSKGADSTIPSIQAIDAAILLAKKYQNVVAVTGKDDYVTDGNSIYKLSNGSAKLALITGTGCSLSAMISAYLAICESPLQATLVAISHMSIAGELAAETTIGIGRFSVILLDKLKEMFQISAILEKLKYVKI